MSSPISPDPAPGRPENADLNLTVVSSSGEVERVRVDRSPFRIGRLPECDLSLRDTRISRDHAQILLEGDKYFLEDRDSRHGVFVNGRKVERHELLPGDRVEFGVRDSYHILVDSGKGSPGPLIKKVVEMPALAQTGDLGRLSAVLEVARALQASLSLDDVLLTAVDAALVVTGAERGFLMLKNEQGELDVRIARSRKGETLSEGELRVPRSVIQKALLQRNDLLSMSFDPAVQGGSQAGHTILALELRSVLCVPLVRIRMGQEHETSRLSPKEETLGVLYMDSREVATDLISGNRELLQTLAIEISTVLENARLLSEERQKRHLEQELKIARDIQQSMLPPRLPKSGWLVASGTSQACSEVGGDYFDVMQLSPEHWGVVLADVSGKGVSAALLASLIQGAFFATASLDADLSDVVSRVNRYVCERARNARFATVFYCRIEREGRAAWVNAGHCPALLVQQSGEIESLEATSTPVGLFLEAEFPERQSRLSVGDKLVVYSDGVSEAANWSGELFGEERFERTVAENSSLDAPDLLEKLLEEVTSFTAGAPQKDDVTLLVLGYQG